VICYTAVANWCIALTLPLYRWGNRSSKRLAQGHRPNTQRLSPTLCHWILSTTCSPLKQNQAWVRQLIGWGLCSSPQLSGLLGEVGHDLHLISPSHLSQATRKPCSNHVARCTGDPHGELQAAASLRTHHSLWDSQDWSDSAMPWAPDLPTWWQQAKATDLCDLSKVSINETTLCLDKTEQE
jgi:hypothetical protein